MAHRRYRRRKKDSAADGLAGLLVLGALWLNSKGIKLGSIIILIILLAVIIIALRILGTIKRKQKLLNSGIDVVDRLSGKEFEYFLLTHFENLGYKVDLTPDTNDYGADLILKKDGTKIVVQAKRWNQSVGIEAIQQVIGAVKYYDAQKAMVITNSYFTPNAAQLAKANQIDLWDRDKLTDIMAAANGKTIAAKVVHEHKEEIKTCPRCQSKLILRNGKRGRFWGCSSFPKCRYTVDC